MLDKQNAYIKTYEDLTSLCDDVRTSGWCAVDTEFVWERTYYPTLGIVQIATDNWCAIIDPQAIDDLSPLWNIMEDPDIITIMHSAHNDIQILIHAASSRPSGLFDTQIAASLLGLGDCISYANLIETLAGIKIVKEQQRTDWCKRPLTEEQLSYALDDVRHLFDAYKKLSGKLEDKNRKHWNDEENNRVETSGDYGWPEHKDVYKRVKSYKSLKHIELNRLCCLASWREEKAQQINRPRSFILSDMVLNAAVKTDPKTVEELRASSGISSKLATRYGKEILETLQIARVMPESEWPTIQRPLRETASMRSIVKKLMAFTRSFAKENEIGTTMLATKSDVQDFARQKNIEEIRIMQSWRWEILSENYTAIINGTVRVVINENETVELVKVDHDAKKIPRRRSKKRSSIASPKTEDKKDA